MKQPILKILLLLIISFTGMTTGIDAQFYHFGQYSLEEGLPQSEVTSIVEDHLGYLWVGTNGGGLCRFNGKSFDVYSRKNGLHENIILGLYFDNNFNLWIGSPGSILRYDGKNFHKIFLSDTAFFMNEIKFYETADGIVWIHSGLTDNRRAFFKIVNDSLVEASLLYSELKDKSVLYVTRINSDYLVISTAQGLYDIRGGKLSPSQLLPSSENELHIPLLVDRSNDVWTLTFDKTDHLRKLQLFRSGKFLKDISLPEGSNLYGILNSYQDREGGIWFSIFDYGVIRYFNGEWKSFTEKNGLPINSVRTIHEDSEENFWFGTLGAGLVRYSGDLFISFDTRSGMSDDIVRSIYQDSKGNYYFGVNGNALNIYDGKEIRVVNLKGGEGTGYISAMYEVRPGVLLLATFSGLYEFNGKSLRSCSKEYGLERSYPVFDIKNKGDTLYFSVFGYGVVESINGKASFFNKKNSDFKAKNASSLFFDSKDNLWICSDKGIWLYNSNLTNISKKYNLGITYILQAAEDKRGNIWFATYTDGLLKFDGDTFTVVDASKGLISDNIYSVISDDNGNIWAGTQNGVDKLTIDNSGNIASIENFGKYDGFTGIENNGKANFRDREGNLWFGTIKGAIMYSPAKRHINYLPPPVFIKDVRIGFRQINWNYPPPYVKLDSVSSWLNMPEGLTLPHDRNHISFSFDGLCYTVPEKVKYKWRLDPLEKNLIPATKMDRAVYSSLPPGKYTFYVKACNNSGVWNDTPAVYSFTIKAAWWQTTEMKLLIVLLLFALTILIIRMRKKRRELFKKEMSALLESRTAELKKQKDELAEKEKQLEQAKRKNAELNAEIEIYRKNVGNLAGIAEAAISSKPFEDIFMSVYYDLAEIMDIHLFGVGIINREKKTLEFQNLIVDKERAPFIRFTLDDKERIAVLSCTRNQEILAGDILKEYKNYVQELRPLSGELNPHSVIFVPVKYRGKVLGVVTAHSTLIGVYNEYHLNVMRIVAGFIASVQQR